MNILVTGASKGIGKVIAQELKSCGNVYVTARNEEALKAIGCSGYFVCDLAYKNDLIKLGDFIEEKKIIYCITMAFESHFYNIQALALLSTLSTFKYMPFSFLKNCTLIR